jgi:all-trans-8'-apo-beta-carotenal 15,15'-oxygenase
MVASMIDHQTVFKSQPETFAETAKVVEGAIPRELSGTLLRNGPGVMEAGRDPLNFFDAHGMIAAVGFRDGRATFRAEHVATELAAREKQAGKQVGRRVFSAKPGLFKDLLDLKIPSTASHDVVAWGGKVLATHDDGYYALDPATLRTTGPDRFGGAVPPKSTMGPMPREDVTGNRLVGYSIKPGGPKPDEITFHELDDQWKEVARVTAKLSKGAAFVHDLAITKRFYVVCETGLALSVMSVLLGRGAIYDAFQWGAPSKLVLVPRAGGEPRFFEVDAKLIFHFLNAYEDGEKVIIDVPAYDNRIDFHAAAPEKLRARDSRSPEKTRENRLTRYTIDLTKGTVESRRLTDIVMEAPEVARSRHGLAYRYAYGFTPASYGDEPDPNFVLWFHGIAKLDVESGATKIFRVAQHEFVSPPTFAPRPGGTDEDDGWILAWVLDARASSTDVVILDARDMTLVARVSTGRHLPQVSHTRFEESVTLADA